MFIINQGYKMYCYTRYMIYGLLGPVTVITSTLTGIIWLTQSLRFIDLIVNRGLDFSTFLYLSSLLIPSLISIVLPIALFVAVLFLYHKMVMDSELIVLKNSGLSHLSLAKPALIVAGGMTVFAYCISFYVSPLAYREFKDMQAFIRDNYASVLLQEGVFNTPINGLTVYIEERQDNGWLKGILVHDHRATGKPVTMMAQKGIIHYTETGPQFELWHGNRQEMNHKDGQLSLLYFDRYVLDLSIYVKPAAIRWREPQERFVHELFQQELRRPEMKNKLNAELHQRLTWPLYNIALASIAVAGMCSGPFNRRGQWKRVLAVTAFALLAVSINMALQSAIATTPWLTPFAYLNIVAMLGAGAYGLSARPLPSFGFGKKHLALPLEEAS